MMEKACQPGNLFRSALALCLFCVAGVVTQQYSATCTIQPLGLPGMNISGVLHLTQSGPTGNTTVVGYLYGFTNGTTNQRGFHVHQTGNVSDNCIDAGLHYNPFNMSHGGPNDAIRHEGDLGNIVVDSNFASFVNITDNMITLNGIYSIVNRSIVVHSGQDDLGKGNFSDSLTTGHSGTRIGCCVIILDQQVITVSPAPTNSSAGTPASTSASSNSSVGTPASTPASSNSSGNTPASTSASSNSSTASTPASSNSSAGTPASTPASSNSSGGTPASTSASSNSSGGTPASTPASSNSSPASTPASSNSSAGTPASSPAPTNPPAGTAASVGPFTGILLICLSGIQLLKSVHL